MPTVAPIYEQVASLRLYRSNASSQAAQPGFWAGYLPSAQAAFGATATLDQLWQDAGGAYLFLNAAPADAAAFLASLEQYLSRITPAGAVRFVWIANPNDAWGAWQTQTLFAVSSGQGQSIVWTIPRQTIFPLGNYGVQIERQATLTQSDPNTLGYGIAIDAAHVTWLATGGAWAPDASTAWLPLAGASLGAWCATLTFPAAAGSDAFAALGMQLRYAAPASSDPTSNAVRMLAMPVMHQGNQSVRLFASFDPLNPLTPARTQFAFFAPGSPATLPAFSSTLTMALGQGVTLQPIAPAAPLSSARLVFNISPIFLTTGTPNPYVDYYLAPDGAFALTQAAGQSQPQPSATATATPHPPLSPFRGEGGPGWGEGTVSSAIGRLPLGVSGLEYVALPGNGSAIAFFTAGKPAFAPGAAPGTGQPASLLDGPLLTDAGTSSYFTIVPASAGQTGLVYYAQPRQAPLYVAADDLGAGFMDFHEMQAATLASYSTSGPPPPTLPMGMYGGIDPHQIAFANTLEQAALAPARRLAIGLPPLTEAATAARNAAEGGVGDTPPPLAVTPQGLVAVLTADQTQWAGVLIANLSGPPLTFAPVGPAFQAALQSNELFFVVSNPGVLMSATSVSYQITPDTLPLLLAAGVPQPVVTALQNLLSGMSTPYPVFPTETAFVQAIGGVAGSYINLILPLTGLLRVSLSGWKFQLSPRSWRAGAQPTIMLFKFCNRTLEQMAADGGAWSWRAAAEDENHDIGPTQEALQAMFKEAAAAAEGSPLRQFYQHVVADPAWNGVLFMNAPVNPQTLPDELKFASAGIDETAFHAHHVGFALTPFEVAAGRIVLHDTAAFALIDYRDPEDLSFESTVPFAFKTLALRARFANSVLVEFSAEVELMLNRLFGGELTRLAPEHGNNLVLRGGYQMQNGVPSYAFVLEGTNLYTCRHSALSSIDVLGVQIQTATSNRASGGLAVDFILSGHLRFIELPDFDLFSYGPQQFYPSEQAEPLDGYLRFGQLAIRMAFSLATPTAKTFTVAEDRISFDIANSVDRPLSLTRRFPVTVTGFVANPLVPVSGDEKKTGQRPEDLGYTSIAAPIDQSLLSPPWYGLVMTLDLGTLGALAGSVGIRVTMLAAWSAGVSEEARPVFLGLQLPDAKALGMTLPVQGVLRVGFRSFQFLASGDDTTRSYMLRLHRLTLALLGWSFPPGTADVLLFGNDRGDPKSALGWYAVYADTAESTT